MCLCYDLGAKKVRDVSVSTYIKTMVCFKIMRIVVAATESLDVCMLIEHDCLCQIKLWQDETGPNMGAAEMPSLSEQSTIMNELEKTLA